MKCQKSLIAKRKENNELQRLQRIWGNGSYCTNLEIPKMY